uniref:Neuropeptide S n=1 Tax=Zosterops lateralis melanops TaxID=1220523 RepID=A0A8D2PGD8_ZOSLA
MQLAFFFPIECKSKECVQNPGFLSRLFKIPIIILSLLNLLRTASRIGHNYWKLLGRWDSCLVLLSSCLSKVGRDEELALGKPLHDPLPHKRSFRNGVGAGIKKTSFRRAKS